jgi:rsbT co-antagonist protein RsbR
MSRIPELLKSNEADLLRDWIKEQSASVKSRADLIKESELRQQSAEFLSLLQGAAQNGDLANVQSQAYAPVRDMLGDISRSRARLGFTPSETAQFVFSFKQPLFSLLRKELAGDAKALADETWAATQLIDGLGLVTTEAYITGREQVIQRQQQDMMELSTPVVKLWEGVVALPLIGTLDSARPRS